MVITGFQAWRAGTRSWNAWVRTEFSCGTVEIGRDITTIDRYTLYIPCIPTKIHERSCNWGDFPIFLTLFYGPNFWIPEEMATNQVVGEGLCFHPSLSGDRSSRSMLPTCRGKRWRKTRWRHQPALASVNFGIDPLPGTQAVPWRDRGNEKNVGAWRVLRSWFMVMSSCKP